MIVSQTEKAQVDGAIASKSRSRAALNLSLLFLVASILSTVVNFVTDQNIYQTAILILFVICSAISLIAALSGKTTASALLMITPSIILIPLFLVQTQGLSLLLAILSISFPIGIASLTLPAKYFRPILVAAIIAGLIATMGDYFWPFEREITSGIAAIWGNVAGVGLLFGMAFLVFRNFPQFSLGAKLISVTILVATLAVLGVAIAIGQVSQTALVERTGENLQTIGQAQALAAGELMFRELTTLQTLSLNESLLTVLQAQNEAYNGESEVAIEAQILANDSGWLNVSGNDPLVTAVLQNKASDELRRFQDLFPENTDIIVTDRYGAIAAATSRTARYYQADEPWWEFAHNVGFGATYFGQPELNERSNNAFIQIGIPIYEIGENGTKQLAGLLRANFSLTSLEDLMAAARFGETGTIKVHFPDVTLALDELGEMQIQNRDATMDELLADMQLAENGHTSVEINGDPTFFSLELVNTLSHQPLIDELGWIVTVQQTEFEALIPIRNQQRLNVLLGTIVVLAAAGGAAVVGQRLTAPIVRLTRVAEKVAAGDLSTQADIESRDEIGTLAEAFNSMALQIRDSVENLERRVQDRTRALETSISVGQRISQQLDVEALVTAVVDEVRDAFDYYHAHIYLVDETDPTVLRMVGGTGEAGQKMLQQGHQLKFGQGLVGRAATTNTAVLVPDVSQESGWLPNALLPKTQAEIAVPIASGDKVIGVLDVQQNVVDGLDSEDLELLRLIANQVAIAYQNARNFMQQQQQASFEGRLNNIQQQIQQTTTIDEALQVAIRELGRELGAEKSMVKMNGGQRNGHYS